MSLDVLKKSQMSFQVLKKIAFFGNKGVRSSHASGGENLAHYKDLDAAWVEKPLNQTRNDCNNLLVLKNSGKEYAIFR
ncbi:hypothetical protein TNCV_3755991 [Trichonephila clavipes]|nr:hypothetical protein TNCV_3755991 [Trichonephila clavipes]